MIIKKKPSKKAHNLLFCLIKRIQNEKKKQNPTILVQGKN